MRRHPSERVSHAQYLLNTITARTTLGWDIERALALSLTYRTGAEPQIRLPAVDVLAIGSSLRKVLRRGIQKSGSPLAGWILLVVMAALASESSGAANTDQATTPGRCPDGRPQSELDAAGRLPLEPHSQRIVCIQVAEGTDRSYRLTDGRSLHVYEHIGALPAKPTRAPTESGTITIGARQWSWITLNASLILSTTTADGIYVELGLPSGVTRSADIDLLKEVAATFVAATR